jgi:hypothetical protein
VETNRDRRPKTYCYRHILLAATQSLQSKKVSPMSFFS